jgi:F0F1-type ATP synthase assembly protein I
MLFDPGNLRKYNEYIGLGAEIAAAMIVPLLIGTYIDKRFNTSPWGSLIGVLLGFLGVFNAIYKVVIRANKRDDDKGEK